MTLRMFRSLAILAWAFLAGQDSLSLAQAAPTGRSIGPDQLRSVRQAMQFPLKSGSAARQSPGSQPDAVALGLAKQKTYQFRSIDYPGANVSYATDFNDGIVVGYSAYPSVAYSAFYFQGNSYHSLSIPGAMLSLVLGINASGQMVGSYVDSADLSHGFFYDGRSFTAIDPPNSNFSNTEAVDISDSGVIVGSYNTTAAQEHGFVYENGGFTIIDPPGSLGTGATGINSSGEIVGYYYTSDSHEHGFELSNGVYSSIDFPLSTRTIAFGINDAGTIAGGFDDAGFVRHGFTYSGSVFTQVDVPGAPWTQLYRVKNNGNVVGVLIDEGGVETHGVIGK